MRRSGCTTVVALRVPTPDASSRYLVQRWLRSGGQRMLAGCSPGTINKITVKVVRRPD